MLKSERRRSSGRPVGPRLPGQAAMILTPGAMTSGFGTDGNVRLGPRGEQSHRRCTRPSDRRPPKINRALGFAVEFMKDFRRMDSVANDGSGEDVGVHGILLQVNLRIGQHHGCAACLPHRLSLLGSTINSAVTNNHLSRHYHSRERTPETELSCSVFAAPVNYL
ncbi:hypothetical protein HPP92_025732 [Vanilla planifolia]|uniref:Uncharacterized protein n=1 Tax=Vanilla planifolia TaxID=51239 RepID=A0A835PL50_VANPL|nr:hypothetical protein HPP92_026012 [Vanilla planifolia]KAG0454428.1 hypothetical protein HPP92_025732 [Vanilla planifolia]